MKYQSFIFIVVFLIALPLNITIAGDGPYNITIIDMYGENLHWKNEKHEEYDFTLVIEYEPDPNTSELSPGCQLWCRPAGQNWLNLGANPPDTKTSLGSSSWRITYECDAAAYIYTEWKAQISITGYQTSNSMTIATSWPD